MFVWFKHITNTLSISEIYCLKWVGDVVSNIHYALIMNYVVVFPHGFTDLKP